ncbi:MAG: preprotein translocase subunit YajC [Nocardioides sp.]
MPELLQLLPLVGIALLFWLLVIRPASRRSKELARMQSSLSVSDEVMLTSGVFGTLRELGEDHVRVEIAEGVTIKVARGAVGSIVRPEPADADGSVDRPGTTEPGAPEEN